MSKDNVFDDQELVAFLADEPELLAVADAFVRTKAESRIRRRTYARRLTLPATVAAALIAVGLLAPWSSNAPAIVDRALAAIEGKPVVHAVVVFDTGDELLDARTGKARPLRLSVEQWYDSRTRKARFISRIDGRITDELLIDRGGIGFTRNGRVPGKAVKGRIDAPLATFISGYRQALAAGRAHVRGSGHVAGHAVWWLEVDTGNHGEGETARVAVDKTTYTPILVEKESGGQPIAVYTIESIETLASADGLFRRPRLVNDVQGTTSLGQRTPVTLGHAKELLGGGGLWPGHTIDGMRLVNVSQQDAKTTTVHGSRQATGIVLTYNLGHASKVELAETRLPSTAYGWPTWLATAPLPPHSVYLRASPSVALVNGKTAFITISGITNPQMLLRVIHALRPLDS